MERGTAGGHPQLAKYPPQTPADSGIASNSKEETKKGGHGQSERLSSKSLVAMARAKARAGEPRTLEEKQAVREYYANYEGRRIDVYANEAAREQWKALAAAQGLSLSSWMAIAGYEKAEGGNAHVTSLQEEVGDLREELAQARKDRLELMERNHSLDQTNRKLAADFAEVLAKLQAGDA